MEEEKNINHIVEIPGLFLFILTVLFIVLKLKKVIDWHWFWVISPTIIPFLISIVILLLVILIGGILTIFG